MFRVLQIDDDEMVVAAVTSVLAFDTGLEVRACNNGVDGVREAAAWCPDLILCDVTMPGMSGLDVQAELLENDLTAQIPLVFTTSRVSAGKSIEFISRGAAGVIAKPFNLKTLGRRVRHYLETNEVAVYDQVAFEDKSILARFATDAELLKSLRAEISKTQMPDAIKQVSHKLAGVAGIYGYQAISEAASALEAAVDQYQGDANSATLIVVELGDLLEQIARVLQPTATSDPGLSS